MTTSDETRRTVIEDGGHLTGKSKITVEITANYGRFTDMRRVRDAVEEVLEG